MAHNNGKQPVYRVTSVKEWRAPREEGVIIPLPSGRVAKLRYCGLEEMSTRGMIPDDLTSLAAEMVFEQKAAVEIVRTLGKRAIDFLNIVVTAAFMEPKVSLEDDLADDEISIHDIDLIDKQAVFMFVTGPTQALRLFRLEQEINVGLVSGSDENSKQAEPTPESSG